MSGSHLDIIKKSYSSPPSYTEIMAGQPEGYRDIRTLGDLIEINYKMVSAKEQMRQNLATLLSSGERTFPGVIGYDDDILPAIHRAILAGHDILLIGQMGQAKTRLAQTAAKTLLSPMPVVRGSVTGDCPMAMPASELAALLDDDYASASPSPHFFISPESASKIRDDRLKTRISWVEGYSRYRYVLATPDISVKDLVGYVDAIKVAKRGVEMYRIDSYSPGQLMQARHGIICIDELPVLDPRKQVALLSVLQEGRFTTGAYPVSFEPEAVFFATANPIDYTHSGKVIEPLYDRLKSHIHTRYPKTVNDEMMIIMQEAQIPDIRIPAAVLHILAQTIHNMRASPRINQEKGVSVRLGIHGIEILAGEALRCRAHMPGEAPAPRLTDMYCLEQVTKFELTDMDDDASRRRTVFLGLLEESIRDSCLAILAGITPEQLESIRAEFAERTFPVSQSMPWGGGAGTASYRSYLESFDALGRLVRSREDGFILTQQEVAAFFDYMGAGCKSLVFPPESTESLLPLFLEMTLEGLRWTTPKILERRDAEYVQA